MNNKLKISVDTKIKEIIEDILSVLNSDPEFGTKIKLNENIENFKRFINSILRNPQNYIKDKKSTLKSLLHYKTLIGAKITKKQNPFLKKLFGRMSDKFLAKKKDNNPLNLEITIEEIRKEDLNKQKILVAKIDELIKIFEEH